MLKLITLDVNKSLTKVLSADTYIGCVLLRAVNSGVQHPIIVYWQLIILNLQPTHSLVVTQSLLGKIESVSHLFKINIWISMERGCYFKIVCRKGLTKRRQIVQEVSCQVGTAVRVADRDRENKKTFKKLLKKQRTYVSNFLIFFKRQINAFVHKQYC